MKQIFALLLLAILGACLPFFADSFVIPNGRQHTGIPSRSVSASARSGAKEKLVRRFLSEQNNDDDEKTPPIPPPTPPVSEVASNEDAEVEKDLSPPSQENVEAERPRVPVPDPPKPLSPPMSKQQQLQVEKPTQPSRSLTPDEQRLTVASGVGGFFVGAVFGVLVDLENPNIDLTMSPILPPVYGAVFVSTFCYVFGGSEGGMGTLVRTTFGGPTVFIGNAITSIIKSVINGAVTSAQNKVKETTDDIKAIPGKIADEIKATPGRVADAAVETATEIADEIKATPGKVADAAVETATEIADEIKATPGRVVKQTKQAVEDVVDDTLDAVEDFVDDVKSIPQKAIDGVESALGVSKPSNPRPPLAPRTATKKKIPIPPKDLPGSIGKAGKKQPLIPSITSLKIPEPPKLSVPKIGISKPSASTQKPDAASRKQTPVQNSTPSKTEVPKFKLPKLDIAKASNTAEPEKPPSAKRDNVTPKFGLPKIDIPMPEKTTTSKKSSSLKKIDAKKGQPKKIEYSFPSEAPTSKTKAPKFDFPKLGSNQTKKRPSSEANVETSVLDAASRRKKESQVKAEAIRLRQEQAEKKRMEAAEKAEEIKRRKQKDSKRKAEAAAELKRIQEEERQQKIEAQRIERIEKAEEIRRQKQLEAEQKAGKAAQQAAERRRIEEQKRQQKIEAQRQVTEKRRQEEQEKKRKAELLRERKAAKAKELQEEKQASAQRAQRKQVAAKSLGQAKSRTTISLGNLFGSNEAKDESEVKLDVTTSKPTAVAPPGVPVVSEWKQNPDGSISGRISGSPNFSDGQLITSSPVAQGVKSYSVVKTSSGSSYFLEQEKQSNGFGFAFGIPKAKKEEESILPQKEERSSSSAIFAAKRMEIEEKKAASAALADERKAANRKAFEEKKAAANSAAEEKKAREAEQRKAVGEAKRQAAEEKKAKAEEQRRAAADAKRRAAEEKKAKAVEQRRTAAEAKRRVAEEKKAKAAEERRVAAEAKNRAAEEKKAEAEERKAAVNRKRQRNISAPEVELPPKGVPVIKSWKKRSDGGVSGRIYGSPNFEEGDFIETSPILNGKIENGSTVATKSKSRYFLSADTAVKKSNIMAAFKDLAGAKPGATITLTKERKEREAKAAVEAIEKAKPRSTFSLFGLGLGDLDKGLPPKEPIKVVPNKNARKNSSTSDARVAPKGVPTVSRWKLNRDGSISGIISGSVDFNEGERVTTSMVANGRIESGEVVTTGSGSRYFLA